MNLIDNELNEPRVYLIGKENVTRLEKIMRNEQYKRGLEALLVRRALLAHSMRL